MYLRKLDTHAVPDETEADGYVESDVEQELDVTKPGKQSGRMRKQLSNTATCSTQNASRSRIRRLSRRRRRPSH